jgi:hypothetical protein
MLQISLLYALAGGALDLFVLSVSYVLQHYNIARSMHVVFTYVAGRQQYGTCSPACMYKSSLTSSFICIREGLVHLGCVNMYVAVTNKGDEVSSLPSSTLPPLQLTCCQ